MHPSNKTPWLSRMLRPIPTLVGLAMLVGLISFGIKHHWRIPSFAALRGAIKATESGWCAAHGVPEEMCVECNDDLYPKAEETGWCKKHGVHECPLCHPEVAQLADTPEVPDSILAQAESALAYKSRTENNKQCKNHKRRIQFASPEAYRQLNLGVQPVRLADARETISGYGELEWIPTTVARVSARTNGRIVSVTRQLGDWVNKGDVLAVLDCAAIGQAKTEYLQAVTEHHLAKQRLSSLKRASDAVTGLFEAEADVEAAKIKVISTQLALNSLGLPIRSLPVERLDTTQLNEQLRRLGIDSTTEIPSSAELSSNLLTVRAPCDGELVERSVSVGELADSQRPLFVLADTKTMRIRIELTPATASKVKVGQEIRFQHDGHAGWDVGEVTYVSEMIDDAKRTVSVFANLKNPERKHHAHSFGVTTIITRHQANSIMVAKEALHWEGDCHVVFVRDKNFDQDGKPKIFHVRSVRPGATDIALNDDKIEIIAGLLPGELVATTNSGILRSELLKGNLGEG